MTKKQFIAELENLAAQGYLLAKVYLRLIAAAKRRGVKIIVGEEE